ncbi:MAG: DinB family protein [Deltaproteobacteria bacterium]|nr:DinB family protein [Deltaproteobacteria bacterium]
MISESNGIATSLLPEFDLEMANTRKVLERVPEEAFSWKPHPKSFSMGELAGHVASIPGWLTSTLTDEAFDVSPGGVPAVFPRAASSKEALSMFDDGIAVSRSALQGTSDATFLKSWALLANGEPLFTMPRVAVVRTFVMNHLIHHRAQLCVYLRQNDVPVPALYGPSADEQG